MSSWVLNVSKYGNSRTSPEPMLCNFIECDFCSLPVLQPVSQAENSLAFSSSVVHTMYLYTLVRFPLSRFFSRLNSPISLSLSQYGRCFNLIFIFVAGLPSVTPKLSHTRHPRTGQSTSDVVSAVLRRDGSLSLLAAFFLMKPRRL